MSDVGVLFLHFLEGNLIMAHLVQAPFQRVRASETLCIALPSRSSHRRDPWGL